MLYCGVIQRYSDNTMHERRHQPDPNWALSRPVYIAFPDRGRWLPTDVQFLTGPYRLEAGHGTGANPG
ncbi:hypothetical protein M514_21451 [Trichuris suis]|uniref:Uncharacterized protein n=1 Tax=Trichuris suis TaxID=68888 RepID=A0A085NAC5_9BILA|nr:hypothetical protein M514_21451 [Trichuris suis]